MFRIVLYSTIGFLCALSMSGYADVQKSVKLMPQQQVPHLDVDALKTLTLISRLLNVDDVEISARVSTLYSSLEKDGAIVSDERTARHAILLKTLLSIICNRSENGIAESIKSNKNTAIDDVLNAVSNVSNYYRFSIDADTTELVKKQTVHIPKELFPLLLLTESACEGMDRTKTDDDVDLTLNRAGFQKMSAGIRDTSSGVSDNLTAMLARKFGFSSRTWDAEKRRELKELQEHGFLEVDDDQINNLNESYSNYKDKLKDADAVKEKLAFSPSAVLSEPGFRFLGAEAVDTATYSGYAGVATLYETSMGKMLITENDLVASEGFTLIEPEFLDTKIGTHDASMIVLKGKENGLFKTELYWYNKLSGREYTVEVNANLNDSSMEKEKALLIEVLSTSYGNQ